MRYQGGKWYERKWIAAEMSRVWPDAPYWEPFCGMCSVMTEMPQNVMRLASDVNLDLVMMWQALTNGWEPPDDLSVEEYQNLKRANPCPLRCFAGFGCSYAGKWFGGYARDANGSNYAGISKRSVMKKVKQLHGVQFEHGSYDSFPLPSRIRVYADPPYENDTGYGGAPPFDHGRFWDWCRVISQNNYLLVSSFVAPPDFECMSTFETRETTRNANHGAHSDMVTERLFSYRSGIR